MTPTDRASRSVPFRLSEIEHRYGDAVHVLSDPLALGLLARLSRKETRQPEVNWLLRRLFGALVQTAVAAEFPRRAVDVESRMIDSTPRGVWSGEVIDPHTPTVVAAIARAGLLPSEVAYDFLTHLLDSARVRLDHFSVARVEGPDGHVAGASVASAKIGGAVDGALVLVPDPMGATGSTLLKVLDLYAAEHGRPRRTIALHLIVTPEFLRAVRRSHPEVVVYAYRLDRGLSSPEILETVPGERWDEERGLDEHDYIVPGAGGLGEVITNSWV